MVLTDTQYASDILSDSHWPEKLRADMAYADAVFFFGYSLRDLDIARILYRDPALKDRTFFVIGSEPDADTRIMLRHYGQVITRDIAEVAPDFTKIFEEGFGRGAAFPANFDEIENQVSDRPANLNEIYDHLIKGDTRPEFIANDLVNVDSVYYFSRSYLGDSCFDPGGGPLRNVVHGRLASGKSDSVFELAYRFKSAGWRVFRYNELSKNLSEDIEFFSSLSSDEQFKCILLFENPFSVSKQIKFLIQKFPAMSVVSLTRSAALQTRIGSLEEDFGEEFDVFDISRLSEEEMNDLDDILFSAGLWGERQGYDKEERLDFISRQCKEDLATVLVAVCKASSIYQKIGALIASEGFDSLERRSVITILACAVAGKSTIGLSQICDIASTDVFKAGATQGNRIIAEFVDFERGRVSARSPAFAQTVMAELIPDEQIIEELPYRLDRLAGLRSLHVIYNEIYKSLMRYSTIETMISDPYKYEKLQRYYENIRSLRFSVDDPQFWLQYAIACMAFDDYAKAERHFDTAFGLADRRGGYDPYQIENHYARFLIQSRLQTENYTDFFQAFSDANDIVQKQVASFREGFYPYRIAMSYLDYIDKRIDKFSLLERGIIAGWCDDLLAKSERAREAVRGSKYYEGARQALSAAKDILAE